MRTIPIALYVVVGTLVVGTLLAWHHRCALRRERAFFDGAIKPPKVLHEGFDPALRERSAERRSDADELRKRAAGVESGSASLRVVHDQRKRA